jgi:hypothetical protein
MTAHVHTESVRLARLQQRIHSLLDFPRHKGCQLRQAQQGRNRRQQDRETRHRPANSPQHKTMHDFRKRVQLAVLFPRAV